MEPGSAYQWIHVHAPRAAIREPAGDGLELEVRAMTVPSADHGEFATGDVVTVSQGVEKVHENVLFSGDEPGNLAGFLDAALSTPRGDRTASLFDDEMTLKIEGDGHGRWSVECRPVPLPPPDAMWDTFPAFSFELSAAAMQRAVAELQALSASLARRRADLKP